MSVTKEMTIDELRQQLAPAERMERVTFDPRSDAGRFVYEAGKINFETRNGSTHRYDLTSEAYIRLAQMVGIPGAYVRKTPHSIMISHVNYWLANRGLSQITFASEDGVIRMFSKGAMEPVSNELILEAIRGHVGDKLQVYHASHDLFRTTFSIVSEELEYQVDPNKHQRAKGDPVRFGVAVENSYALAHPLTISAYVHRLVCTNGAISVDNVFRFARRGGGTGDGHEDWINDAIQQAFAAADAEVARLRDMKEVKFNGHLSAILSSIFTEYGVPLKVRDDISNLVMDRRVDNLYDLYNTVTYVASNNEDVLEDPALAMRLMRIGGRMSSHPQLCESCHRVLT